MGRPEFFPRRNRIIAGLSLGTLVIEAGLSSGSLITARFAAEQGREVFAVPGSIRNALTRGCHKLIRDGAKLVECADDVLDELRGVGGVLADGLRGRLLDAQRPAPPIPDSHTGDPNYARVLATLSAGPSALDELVVHTGLPAAALSSMLLALELDGAVVAENGRYSRR
jgi:DNA processing protein